jgi:hypothetical protein
MERALRRSCGWKGLGKGAAARALDAGEGRGGARQLEHPLKISKCGEGRNGGRGTAWVGLKASRGHDGACRTPPSRRTAAMLRPVSARGRRCAGVSAGLERASFAKWAGKGAAARFGK